MLLLHHSRELPASFLSTGKKRLLFHFCNLTTRRFLKIILQLDIPGLGLSQFRIDLLSMNTTQTFVKRLGLRDD